MACEELNIANNKPLKLVCKQIISESNPEMTGTQANTLLDVLIETGWLWDS